MREDVLGQLNDRINDMMSEVLQSIEATPAKDENPLYNVDKYRDKKYEVRYSESDIILISKIQLIFNELTSNRDIY